LGFGCGTEAGSRRGVADQGRPPQAAPGLDAERVVTISARTGRTAALREPDGRPPDLRGRRRGRQPTRAFACRDNPRLTLWIRSHDHRGIRGRGTPSRPLGSPYSVAEPSRRRFTSIEELAAQPAADRGCPRGRPPLVAWQWHKFRFCPVADASGPRPPPSGPGSAGRARQGQSP
jgi:hypothetical protein